MLFHHGSAVGVLCERGTVIFYLYLYFYITFILIYLVVVVLLLLFLHFWNFNQFDFA